MSLAALREISPDGPLRPATLPSRMPGVTVGRPEGLGEGGPRALSLGLGDLDAALPDGGLPRGAVTEIASPYGLARASSIALAACVAAQRDAKLRGGEATAGAWCAWIEGLAASRGVEEPPTLFAPAAVRAGVDLDRLLVIRPPLEALSRVVTRAAESRVFAVIVVDLVGVPGRRAEVRLDRWPNPVRRLAMAAEHTEMAVVLLTDALAPRPLPLPVALRIEIERAAEDRLSLTVAKDRRGRVTGARSVSLGASRPGPASCEAPLPARLGVAR